jgi:gliding motility-associated-like protein
LVTINALPIPVATNNGPACETKSIQLTGTGTGTFLWTGPNGFNSALQNPTLGALNNLNGGVYTVSIVDANSCVGSATTAVVVNANPVANTTNANVCFGSAATLTVSGGGTYLWSGPNGFTSTLANPQIPVVNASTSGNYTILVTAANGCTNTNVANVSFNPIPTASISGTTRACVNSTIALQGSGGFIYSWSGPSNFVSASQNLTLTASNVNMSGTYTLSVLNQAGCANYATMNVIIDPLPNGTLVSDGNNSCVPFCANFSLSPVAGNSPIVSNVWQLNNQTFTSPSLNYCFRTAGSYVVNGSFVDVNGCSNSATFAINAYPAPVADFEYSPLKPVENLDNVLFSNSSTSTDITGWNWYFVNNNGYTSTQTNPSYMFEQSGNYPIALVVHNKYGCSDTIVKMITVVEEQNLYVPNSFTPNGDGINDIFLPKGKGLTKYNLMIFDRWGQKLFETSEFTVGWDGAFKGLECKQDTYVWKITASFPQGKVKEYTGHITLNR